ncbi:MAG: serine/threonine-protein kinase, partial [Acidobacteriota bacterium]
MPPLPPPQTPPRAAADPEPRSDDTRVLEDASSAAVAGEESSWSAGAVRWSEPQLDSQIGPFRLLSFLGRGGMGQVYKAVDTRLDRVVALKLLLPGPPALEQRFQREARAQANIDHEGVCKVFEVGSADGRPFIAMQYLDGLTLGDAAEHLTLEEKVLVMGQVAEAIHAAHLLALVHRDLKPGNIMVQRREGALKALVLDFGMVRESGDAQLTVTGEVLGSPSYMAPEQLEGDLAAIDRRTDVYGLGAVFYEILVGRPPIEGKNVIDTLRRAATEDPALPRSLRPEIPPDLEWIVLRCLEKDPTRRYRSAVELIEDLERFRAGEPVQARQSTWRYRWEKRIRRRWRIYLAAALAGLAGLGVIWNDLERRYESREKARLAAFFMAEVNELEWRLRVASVLPLHDTRPERERLRERLEKVEQRVAEAGELAEGPGYFALGRGYRALGETDLGFRYLEKSRAAGFEDPSLFMSLGLAYGEQYEESLADLDLEPDSAARSAETRQAEERYRTQAIAFLNRARAGGREESAWISANLAFYESRWDVALAALQDVEETSPWLYETLWLRGAILHKQALEALGEGRDEQGLEFLDRSEEVLRQAVRAGESDPRPYAELCDLMDT